MKSDKNFKHRVLEVVKKISKGKVVSYKEVAKSAGRPKAYRAVGNILNKNYDPDIPCHRVVATNGIGGYNHGVKEKIRILVREGVKINNVL